MQVGTIFLTVLLPSWPNAEMPVLTLPVYLASTTHSNPDIPFQICSAQCHAPVGTTSKQLLPLAGSLTQNQSYSNAAPAWAGGTILPTSMPIADAAVPLN